MGILIVLLYIFLIILIIITVLLLSFLLIPLNYQIDGGYNNQFWSKFNLRCYPILTIKGDWDNKKGQSLKLKVVVLGITFSLNPDQLTKDKQKQGQGNRPLVSAIFRCLDRELIGDILKLLGDLYNITKPKRIEISGKLGFGEPHLNGWIDIINYMISGLYRGIKLNVEPVWHEEHYEFNFVFAGNMMLTVMAYKLTRLLLAPKTRRFLKILKTETQTRGVKI